jgi:hypothetical protein
MGKILVQFLDDLFKGFGISGSTATSFFVLCIFVYFVYKKNRYIIAESGKAGIDEEIQKTYKSLFLHGGDYNNWIKWFAGAINRKLGDQAWSKSSYLFCIKFSVFYTATSVFVIWCVFGGGNIGGNFFVASKSDSERVVYFLGMLFLTYCVFHFNAEHAPRRLVYLIIATMIPVAQVITGMDADIVVFGGIASFSFIFLTQGRKALWTYSFIIAVFTGILFTKGGDVFKGIAFSTTVFGLMIGSFGYIITVIKDRIVDGRWVYITMIIGFIVITVLVDTLSQVLKLHPIVSYYILFMIWFPIVNSVFDWVALGHTRFSLGQVLRGRSPYFMFAEDFGVGVLITYALILATFFGVEAYNWVAHHIARDAYVYNVIKDIEIAKNNSLSFFDKRDIWWIYIMVLTTVIPSAVHGVEAIGWLLTSGMPERLQTWHREQLAGGFEGHPQKINRAAAYMTLKDMISLMILISACGGVWAIISLYGIVLPYMTEKILDAAVVIDRWVMGVHL